MNGKGNGLKKRRFPGLATFILALVLAVSAFHASVGFADLTAYPQEYLDAVKDAQTATAREISRNLVAVSPRNVNPIRLEWEGTPGKSRVLVLTWTNKPYYDNSVGKDYTLPKDANVWVTVVPELKRFVAKHPVEVSTARIEQLLGLPPNNGKTKFVEIWAHPRDLFRPSADPEITDHEAELKFPTALSRFTSFNDLVRIVEWNPETSADVSYTYRKWFLHRKATIYSGETPYPWTRLGYTYDWGNRENHVGLSEFVILGGCTVGIKAVVPNEDYLKASGDTVHGCAFGEVQPHPSTIDKERMR